jgi:hypothetical protein
MNEIMSIGWPLLVLIMLLIAFWNIKNTSEQLGLSVRDLKHSSNQVIFISIFMFGILITVILTGINVWEKYAK